MRVIIDKLRMEARIKGRLLKMTPRAFELLAELDSHDGRIMTPVAILRAVWGYSVSSAEALEGSNTVRQHVSKARKAMRGAARGSERLLVNVPGHGYKLMQLTK